MKDLHERRCLRRIRRRRKPRRVSIRFPKEQRELHKADGLVELRPVSLEEPVEADAAELGQVGRQGQLWEEMLWRWAAGRG